MEPITVLSIISGGFFLYDRWKKGKSDSIERFALPSASGPSPQIGAAELEMFTSVQGGLRHMDRRVSDNLFPGEAPRRSAISIPLGPVGPISPGARVYRVMPLAAGVPTAAEVEAEARKANQVVLVSLSLIGLGWGSTDPMLIVVGGPELHRLALAMPRGDFAILDAASPRVVVESPAEVVSETAAPAPAVEPAPAAKANGAAKVANGADEKAVPAAAPEAKP